MNFLISSTRLVMLDCDTISETTQNWISLKRLMNTSKLAVICVLNSIKWQKFVNNKCKLILWYTATIEVLTFWKSKPQIACIQRTRTHIHTRTLASAFNVLRQEQCPSMFSRFFICIYMAVTVTYPMRQHLSTATQYLYICIFVCLILAYALNSHTRRTTIICCVLSPLVELLYTELSHNDCCFS